MPNWQRVADGAIAIVDGLRVGDNGTDLHRVVSSTVALDPGSINAATRGTQTFALPGAKAGDVVVMIPPDDLDAGLCYVGARVTANDVVTVYIANITAAPVDGTSKTWGYLWFDTNE